MTGLPSIRPETGPGGVPAGARRRAAGAHRAPRHCSTRSLIDRAYLTRLNEAYARFFHAYDESPLLIVNAGNIDPINNEADYEELLGQIGRTVRGRLYYNPLRHKDL